MGIIFKGAKSLEAQFILRMYKKYEEALDEDGMKRQLSNWKKLTGTRRETFLKFYNANKNTMEERG